jgi:hypothetical protein
MSVTHGKLIHGFLVWSGLAASSLVLVRLVAELGSKPAILPPLDLVAFWAAARLMLAGSNPYAPEQIMPIQISAGWSGTGLNMVWEPPWALPLVTPLGWVSYHVAALLWLIANAALVFSCAYLAWCYYGGSQRRWFYPLLLAATFVPALDLLKLGQMSAWVLLGAVGFLFAMRQRHEVLAGLSLGLVALKPHVAFLLCLALLLWTLEGRRWRVILGACLALGSMSGIALLANPPIFAYYVTLMTQLSPTNIMSPNISTLLRIWFGGAHAWVQWLPALAGVVWFVGHWWQRHRAWDWGREVPVLLLVSLLTSPHSWIYDQVLLILPLSQLSATLPQTVARSHVARVAVLYGAVDGLALVLYVVLRGVPMQVFWWLGPAWGFIYVFARRKPTALYPAALSRRTGQP